MISDRRSILAGLALVASAPLAFAQTQMNGGEIDATPRRVDFSGVMTAPAYYAGVLGRAEMSLSTSAVGAEKATQKNTLEFAGFELGEAITVNMVLKDLGTTATAMSADEASIVAKIKSAAKGPAFDRAYVQFQLLNHEYLRDLADSYLHNSAGASDPAEKQGRLLASLMLAVFKEHTAICKRISGELTA